MPKQLDFSVSGTAVCEALSLVAKVVTKEPSALSFRTIKSGLEIRGERDGVVVSTVVPVISVSQTIRFSLPFDRMNSICAKRGTLNFELANEGRIISYWAEGGRYQGEVYTIDYTPVEVVKNRQAEPIDGSNLFNQYIPYVDLKAMDRQEMICFIVSSDGKLQLAAADNYHAVLLQTQTNMPDFQLTIPVKYQKILAAAFGKEPYTLTVESSVFFASNHETIIQLPLFDAGGISFQQIFDYIRDNAEPTSSFELEMHRFNAVLENVASVYEKNRRLEFRLKKNKLSFNMQSAFGKASDVITVEAATSDENPIYTDMALLKDVVDKIAKNKAKINFVADRCMIFKVADEGTGMKLTYIVTALAKKD